jgi:hypothetical protein
MWLSNSDPRITSGGLLPRKAKIMNAVARSLENFVPMEYYESVMDFYGVDTQKYRWMVRDFDPSVGKQVMFAVYNFYCPNVDGWPVGLMVVIYKSLHSKSSFRRNIYLDNMSPACQVPPPYRYRHEGE